MSDFDFQPHFVSSVVRLDPLAAEDWAELYSVASDPKIWADHPAGDRWQEPVFRRFFEEALAGGKAFAARDAATGAVVGSSRYCLDRAGPNEIEIGWTFLARQKWGGQMNAAMKRLMIAHALPHFERVIFLVGENNGRSRRAMEKIGATLTDRVYETLVGENSIRHVVYAIDDQLFRSGPLG